jgi:DMSO/TMAO reductase YedYZ molybdopterin-dependent catalytic subunit
MGNPLPPGQRLLDFFPRFGVPAFAGWAPAEAPVALVVSGEGGERRTLRYAELKRLPRRTLQADFHCVATWSYPDVRWEGWALRDVYQAFIAPCVGSCLEFVGSDGYRGSLMLEDALADEVLLADRMNGAPLTLEHGAPLRLVAPALYGYKNVKHLRSIEVRSHYRAGPAERQTRAHPRGRVALEERGRGLPGWVYRYAYRASFRPMLCRYRRVERSGKSLPRP